MPVFWKIGGVDEFGGARSVQDGTSNTLMIGEHVITAVGNATPEIDDEVLVFPHDEGADDSIWIDIEAPVMRAFDGGRGYVLTQPEHSATNEAQSRLSDTGYGNPSSFQNNSAGADEAESRLFVGNLTVHSEASGPKGEVLIFGEEDAGKVPAVQTGGWIADVTYERFASLQEGDTFPTETIRPVDGAHHLYDLVV